MVAQPVFLVFPRMMFSVPLSRGDRSLSSEMIAGSTLTLNDTDATVTDGYYNDSRLLDSFTDNDDLFDFEDDNLVDF